jgi:hypothetical protein
MNNQLLAERIVERQLTAEDMTWIERTALPLVTQPFARLLITMLLLHARRTRSVESTRDNS